MNISWPSSFVGVPYASKGRTLNGADCYGLVSLIKHHVEGIIVPTVYDYIAADDSLSVSKSVAAQMKNWTEVSFNDRKLFDVLVFNLAGYPVHLGTVITDSLMIHSLRGCDSCIERYDSIAWNRRIEGVYRWVI